MMYVCKVIILSCVLMYFFVGFEMQVFWLSESLGLCQELNTWHKLHVLAEAIGSGADASCSGAGGHSVWGFLRTTGHQGPRESVLKGGGVQEGWVLLRKEV